MVRTNWSADPWARGSYSYLPTGASPELRAKLAVPVGGRLFFAGEATDDGDPGTVHGAQASGRRVAGQVAAAANAGDSVLIVGAGMAGLTAAFELTAGRFAAERYRVSVVEARDRIGGRIDSMKPRGHTMFAERGASWVHAAETHNLSSLVHDAGIETVPFDYDQAILGPNGRRLPGDFADGAAAVVDRAVAWARERSKDSSLAHALQASGAADDVDPTALEHYLTTEVTDEYGVPAAALSARWALNEGSDGDDLLVLGGYVDVAHHLAEQAPAVDISLNTPVAAVAHGPEKVIVTTHNGQRLSAGRVVLTVPLGVLQSGDLTFSPELPDGHLEAVDGLGMGLLDKVILYFDGPFWGETSPMWTRVAPGQPLREWFHRVSGPREAQLMALTGGDVARTWATKSDREVRTAALGALGEFVASGW